MDSDPESVKTLLHHYNNNHHNHHHHHNDYPHPDPDHYHNHPPPPPHSHPHHPHPHHHHQEKPSLYPSVPTSPTTTTNSPMTQKPDPTAYFSNNNNSGKNYPTATHSSGNGSGGSTTQGLTPTETLQLQRRVARLTSYLYGLAITVMVGAILVVALIAALYAKLAYDVRHHSHQPKVGEQISKILEREELCVRCEEVRLGPSPDEEAMLDVFTKRESRDGLRCCVERPAELLRLLELHIEKRYRQEMAKGNIKIRHSSNGGHGRNRDQEKPSAHLMGYPQRQDHNQAPGRQFPIGLWIHEEDLAFTHQVTYRHGRIVVPEDGLYYVYSQVAFLEVLPIGARSSPSLYSTESPSLSHYLYRYNIIYPNGGEEKLVQNSITKGWGGPNRSFGEYTSYLGAVFHLRQGDEVFVKVSNVTMMARDPKSNYFGLFKV